MPMIVQYFGIFGYASVILWLLVPFLWLMYRQHRRALVAGSGAKSGGKLSVWWPHLALGVAVAAYVLAVVNSTTHVNRIQIDRTEEIAEAQARAEAARQKALEARGDDVAQVRFAEDSVTDILDEGGMDDADRKYLSSLDEPEEAAWKREKKTRSTSGDMDDSLAGLLDTSEKEGGAETDQLAEETDKEPIMMSEAHVMRANALDSANLKLIRLLMCIGVGLLIYDYLKRFNDYAESYLPLPLPSAWVNGATPLAPICSLPADQRRRIVDELAWITRRGECFLYISDRADVLTQIPEHEWRFRLPRLGKVDVIRVTDEDPISPDFIFETLWYGRSSFVVDSESRAIRVLEHMIDLMEQRKISRARVRQAVQIVWDLDTPPPEETLERFERMGSATGFVLVLRSVS